MKHFSRFLISAVLVATAFSVTIILVLPAIVKQKLISFTEQHSDYSLEISSLNIGMNEVEIYGISFKPKLDKQDFFRSRGFETDWIKGDISLLKIEGINWLDAVRKRQYAVKHLSITGADIYAYRDKRVRDLFKYKPLLSALIRESGIKFSVSETMLSECTITYEEVQEKNGNPITVVFNRLNAAIRHMSSDSAYIARNPVMSIEADALVFGSIKTQVHYSNHISDKSDEFSMKGTIKSFSATQLNHCIEPATKTRITDGFINLIDFSFTGNENSSSGILNLDYRDLKIEVNNEVKQSRVKTLLANMFIKNKDQEQEDKTHTGEIAFSRRKDRFIFNYWWNSFKTGILSSVLKKPVLEQVKSNSGKKAKPDQDKQRKKDR